MRDTRADFCHQLAEHPSREAIIEGLTTGALSQEQALNFAFRLGNLYGRNSGNPLSLAEEIPTRPEVPVNKPDIFSEAPSHQAVIDFDDQLYLVKGLLPIGYFEK